MKYILINLIKIKNIHNHFQQYIQLLQKSFQLFPKNNLHLASF